MADAQNVTKTSDRDVNATLSGVKWDTLTLTFSFPQSKNFYGPNGNGTGYSPENEPLNNFEALNEGQIRAAKAALKFYEAITNLDFTQITESATQHADLRLAMSDRPETAWGDYPGAAEDAGDSWYRNVGGTYDDPVRGNYAWYTFFHELGHNLGLKHGHEADGAFAVMLTAPHDSAEYSIMTYHAYVGSPDAAATEETWGHPQTPMMYDIAALQHMYGANFSTNSGNTTYRWNPNNGQMSINGVGQGIPGNGAADSNRILLTIWDGNGTDTYDLSNYTTDLKVNLLPGGFSTFSDEQLAELGSGHKARGNVANALLYKKDERSLIENAIGGSGNDNIGGNDTNNVLSGRGGNDTLIGRDGNDRHDGGAGIDKMIGGLGNDTYVVDALSDDIFEIANAGSDTVIAGLSYVLPDDAAVELMRLQGPSALSNLNLTGNKFVNRLEGNKGSNTLNGRGGADTMVGFEGNDRYFVDHAGDVVTEDVGDGMDTVFATRSYALKAGTSVETLRTVDPADNEFFNLIGNEKNNTIEGNRGGNNLTGNAGNDKLRGGGGNDTLNGGDGSDTAIFSQVIDNYCMTRNADGSITLHHEQGSEADGSDKLIKIEFASFAGKIVDLSQVNIECGGGGAETLYGRTNRSDYLHGGGGNDSLFGDRILPEDDPVYEGPENDTLNGGDGNDTLHGDRSNDILFGGDDNDILSGDDGSDTLNGGANNDTLYTTHIEKLEPDRLLGGAGIDLAIIGWGSATALNLNFTRPAVVKSLPDGTTIKDVERVQLSCGSGDDRITGGLLADELYGLAGDDVLDGSKGADRLGGGKGDDVLIVDTSGVFDGKLQVGGDYVIEDDNSGNDTVLTSVSHRLEFNKEIENFATTNEAGRAPIRLTGNEYDQTMTGNAGNNVFDGNPENEIFAGQLGFDVMNGLGGNDLYHVRQPGDVVNEGAGKGNDTIIVHLYAEALGYALKGTSEVEKISIAEQEFGNPFNLTGSNSKNTITGTNGANLLIGLGGDDILTGLDGDDTLVGGDGRDLITGGLGTDTMTGGASIDRFDFDSVAEMSRFAGLRDVITDFEHLRDDIDLSTIDARTDSGAFAFLNAQGAQFTGARGVLRWFQDNQPGFANDRTIVEGDLDGNLLADFQIELKGMKTLTAADFFL